MAQRILFVIAVLSAGIYSFAQTGPERGWTDKNNAEESAAYMIRVSYYEQGYMDANVRVKQDGSREVFEVEPGRIYHVKELRVVGGSRLPAEAMAGAPVSGEIYSAGRMNDWVSTINKQYRRRASWGATYDHSKAEVAIEVRLNPDRSDQPTQRHPSVDR